MFNYTNMAGRDSSDLDIMLSTDKLDSDDSLTIQRLDQIK